jgi:3-dehydroquinate dehydratase / shikimate dehydrogenase
LSAKACLVATLFAPPSEGGDQLRTLPDEVEWLEVRGDLVGQLDPDWLRSHFKGNILFTLRSTAEGGCFEGSPRERRNHLLAAAPYYDLLDLERERDLVPDLLAAISPKKRLISWTGRADLSELRGRVQQVTDVEARLYKLVAVAAKTADGFAPLDALRSIHRKDIVAFATGEAGFWTRLLAPRLGAPFVFGSVGDQRSLIEPGISQLVQDYGLPHLPPLGDLYGIVGSPVAHSLSPRLHNAAYRALGLPGLFVPFQEESFDRFWQDVVRDDTLESFGASIKGLTVVSPHKEAALNAAARATPMVHRAASANIFTRSGRGWTADTTDPEGAVVALRERGIAIRGRKAAVVGCGGAGRAVAAVLDKLGADVTLVNRSLDRGMRAGALLGLPFVLLSQFSSEGYSLIVNATPLGRNGEALPFDLRRMQPNGSVVDLTYGHETTPLVRQALSLGMTAIEGLEVLLIQALYQFRLMTGRDMPRDLPRERLGLRTRRPFAPRSRQSPPADSARTDAGERGTDAFNDHHLSLGLAARMWQARTERAL